MKKEEVIKRMLENKLTVDEFFNYIEDRIVEEDGVDREKARYMIKLFKKPEFCKKETGYSFHELYLINEGLTPEQARYVEENPCIDGPREECDFYRENKKCFGCTNTNGFLYWKTGPDEKLKPVKGVWEELSKKSVVLVSLDKVSEQK